MSLFDSITYKYSYQSPKKVQETGRNKVEQTNKNMKVLSNGAEIKNSQLDTKTKILKVPIVN